MKTKSEKRCRNFVFFIPEGDVKGRYRVGAVTAREAHKILCKRVGLYSGVDFSHECDADYDTEGKWLEDGVVKQLLFAKTPPYHYRQIEPHNINDPKETWAVLKQGLTEKDSLLY